MANEPPTEPVGGLEENIGFVFPVYFWGLPRVVKQFIEKLDMLKGTYIFAIANYKGFKFDTRTGVLLMSIIPIMSIIAPIQYGALGMIKS